ncbi:MAG TPA: right-handed parallel beta-helix repeat-containing protein [Verrucomicrobiae bacterium]|nr:right-handed parallel beta-helix repeat-containing protein [Verrucomicrobiae bacterium]
MTGTTISRAAPQPLNLYVATNGNDQWSGRLPAPTRDGKDGPLATIPAALKRTGEAKKGVSNSAAADQVNILLRGGTYQIAEPIRILATDSGVAADNPLTMAAYRDETPVLSGGQRITGWKRVGDVPNKWQAEIPEVREGKWYFRQLFIDGHRRTRARTPNAGYFQIDGEYLSDNPVKFKFRGDDIRKQWTDLADVEVIGLQKWVDYRQPIAAVDEVTRTVSLPGLIAPHTRESNARYFIENAPDGLDSPGEWYLDRKTGVLSYLAKDGEDLSKAEVVAPRLTTELIRFEGDFAGAKPVHDVVIRGLTFACTDWTMGEKGYTDTQAAVPIRGDVLAEGAVDCVIETCTFTGLGGYGLELGRGCKRWRVVGNEFVDLGAGGVRLGEPAKRQEPFEQNFGHVVTDNHLHQLGRVYAPAIGIIIFQSGQNRIAHNHIHDLYYTAISVGWNWGYQETPCRENILEFNHMHDIGQGVLSDMGAVYTLGIQKGTIIRNNLIHDVNAHSYGGWGLYTDEGSTEIVMENNVVYRCKSATFHQHYGRDNIIRNNILAFGKENQLMRSREEAHNSFTFERNIVYFDSGNLLGSTWSNDRFKTDNNVYWDARPGAPVGGLKFKDATPGEWQKRGHDKHSVIADPLFVGPEKLDFRLKRDSPAFKLGFKPIDLDDVGVREKFRKQVRDTQ